MSLFVTLSMYGTNKFLGLHGNESIKSLKRPFRLQFFNFQLISCTFVVHDLPGHMFSHCEQLTKSFVELSLANKSTGNFGTKKLFWTNSIRNLIENSLIYFPKRFVGLDRGSMFWFCSESYPIRKIAHLAVVWISKQTCASLVKRHNRQRASFGDIKSTCGSTKEQQTSTYNG